MVIVAGATSLFIKYFLRRNFRKQQIFENQLIKMYYDMLKYELKIVILY